MEKSVGLYLYKPNEGKQGFKKKFLLNSVLMAN